MTRHGRNLERLADPDLLARAAASRVATLLTEAATLRGRCSIVLAGGSTPRALYRALAAAPRGTVPWTLTSVFFGDERCVPPEHPESNYRSAHDALLAHVPVLSERVHRIRGELDAPAAAEDYERVLRSEYGGLPVPAFDVVLLGIGTDGHTASLFPGARLDEGEARWVVAADAPPSSPVKARVTLTPVALCGGTTVIVLAAGREKRGVVSAVFARGVAGDTLPAARIRGRGETVWMVDADAAPVGGAAG
ncbi:MAG: 6-phosphogluconolactonase [Gemmatimonadaceae bacterium]